MQIFVRYNNVIYHNLCDLSSDFHCYLPLELVKILHSVLHFHHFKAVVSHKYVHIAHTTMDVLGRTQSVASAKGDTGAFRLSS